MKTRTIVTMLLACLVAGTVCFAGDANLGTWKLNEPKSKITAGTAKNLIVIYEAAGDKVKVIVDGVGADGKPSHNEWTGMFDGKDYAVSGDPGTDTRSYKKVDDRTLEVTNKKGDKVTATGRIVLAADGKSRTLTINGTDAKGKEFKNTAVYDKK